MNSTMNPTKGLLTGITIESDEYKDSFKRRMRLYLANGYTISMVYGTGMYSHTLNGERHGDTPPGGLTTPEAKAVEMAVLDPMGKFVPFKDSEEVRGYTDMDTMLGIVWWAASLPPLAATV
jgi:hypothetical protein